MKTESSFFTVSHLSAGYGSKAVLRDISFSLRPHTLTGLLGANGCGKTTLLRAVCGGLPYTGDVCLEGQSLKRLRHRSLSRLISYIPQKSGVTVSLPALEVVLMGFHSVLRPLGYPDRDMRRAALSALETVGLPTLADRDYLTLSEGQKQLCILARTLVEDTKLLLLDEPDSALDFHHRYHILRTLRSLVRPAPKAGLLCLHDPQLALECCDQLLLLRDGRCIASLSPRTDSLTHMQEALSEIYGPLSLARCRDQNGGEHLVPLSL